MSTSVFVTGASGSIGGEVCRAFRAAGYRVYGLVRSESKGAPLVLDEIIPVIGDLAHPESYRDAVARSQIIVDNVLDFSQFGRPDVDPATPNRNLLELTASTAWDASLNPKTYIYTSGLLVYGHDDRVVDENTEPTETRLQWRIDFEREVLRHDKVNGVVIRPSLVYGKAGSYSAALFKWKDDTLIIRGRPGKQAPVVHITDLADAYVRAARAGRSVRGEIFNISGYNVSDEDLRRRAAAAAGFRGKVEWREPDAKEDFLSAFTQTVIVNSQKAQDRLGWRHQHLNFLDELDLYLASARAHEAAAGGSSSSN